MDSKILAAVIEDMRSREQVGKVKYGTTMDREDLNRSMDNAFETRTARCDSLPY